MQDAKKMSEKGKTCGKERKGLLGKNNRNDNAALNIYPHLDALGLTRCGASSEERGLKASTAFGSERILKIAAQKIIIDYSISPQHELKMDGNRGASSAKTIGNPKKAQPNPGSIGDLIGSNIDYSLAPKRISQASPRSTTRYGANQEWTRNTSSVIVPIPNSAFYVDEKIRLENKGFVDLQSIVKKSQNAAKLAKLVPRNQCSS